MDSQVLEPRFRGDPNFHMLLRVADALGELREELVFLGGCATSLLLTRVRAQAVRVTKDVDAVAEAITQAAYHDLEKRLAEIGFYPDTAPEAPICRKLHEGIRLDVMPSNPDVLGFCNYWYPEALRSALRVALTDAISIRLVAAPVFIACKLEAFKDRGRGDYLASHDLEDLLTVVDDRDALSAEIAVSDDELRRYIREEFSVLLNDDDFIAALPGHLPADMGAQARLPLLLKTLREIAEES